MIMRDLKELEVGPNQTRDDLVMHISSYTKKALLRSKEHAEEVLAQTNMNLTHRTPGQRMALYQFMLGACISDALEIEASSAVTHGHYLTELAAVGWESPSDGAVPCYLEPGDPR